MSSQDSEGEGYVVAYLSGHKVYGDLDHCGWTTEEEAYVINNSFFTTSEDIITWVWALPLATAMLGGGAPESYHHHTPIFYRFT